MTGRKLRETITHTDRFLRSILKWGTILVALFSLTACKGLVDGMLNPKGIIAFEERKLFFDTLALMLIVVLPVIVMSLTFVYHYRVSHRVRDYKPNWSHSYFLESLWWGIPCVIIIILATMTWKKTIALDPYKKITPADQAPLVIQAIALPWKWVFIYPEQGIATVNYLVVPVGREVEYWITTDNVPMSAFFVPQVGSQIYAMAGMRTHLYLLADHEGDFVGMNTMYNGDGFSDMKFMAHAMAPEKMQQWFDETKKSSVQLTDEAYKKLLVPSINDKPQFFTGVANNFFQDVVNLYMNSSGPVHPRENTANFNTVKE
jgi:cytochrome o ubiquinol oxidase subunit 2